ncbi:endonuclease/exonuclease/phosphatase family protein [Siccirubricoccus phaeus]|uniref:endonuclease/exonuclease/phosphatase family protein n=1 Tax=Siccirubricoccus phaeus TaxID=2595053 RepID=UPI0011F0BC60|nr:endonuclease/exonuclease/phosphatase family protein [Siccirubricoccus phaeus]
MRRAILLLLMLCLARPLAAAELKLASWNIAWLTLRSAELPRDQRPRTAADFDRLAQYAARLDADILALQEVDGPEAAARVLDPRAYAFFFPEEEDLQRAGFAVKRGLRVRQNPDLAGLDLRPRARFSLRRGTDITVETPSGPLRLLSIHLIAGCRDAPLGAGEACESLDRQAEILAGWVAARQAEGVAFAILGDFNRAMAGPQDALLRRLHAAGPLTRVTEGVSDPCWRGGRRFIDQILLGGKARDWLVPGSLRVMVYEERDPRFRDRLSDHCPLSVRLGGR